MEEDLIFGEERKTCTRCHKSLPVSEFYKKPYSDRPRSKCKKCFHRPIEKPEEEELEMLEDAAPPKKTFMEILTEEYTIFVEKTKSFWTYIRGKDLRK